MSMQSTESSHPLLSHADSIAASSADALVLVGRVLLGWIFLASSSGIGGKLWNVPGFAGYLKNLGMPAPEFWSWIGAPVEFVICAAHILACKKPCIAEDALGHQFGVLDYIGRVADDTWDKHLARRKLHVLPHLPFVRMARIGAFDHIGTHIHLKDEVNDILEWNVGGVRPRPASPTDVITHALSRQARNRVVEHLQVHGRPFTVVG